MTSVQNGDSGATQDNAPTSIDEDKSLQMLSNRSPLQTRIWRDQEQYLYSLLWSAFLDLDRYSASRTFQRFRPYSVEWVMAKLIGEETEVSPPRPLLRKAGPGDDFLRLALWSIAPSILRAGDNSSASPDARARAKVLRSKCQELEIDLALSTVDPETRPPLPPFPDLRIGQTEIAVTGGRRCARVRLCSTVQIRYEELTRAIDPGHWSVCGFWRMPEIASPNKDGAITAVLRLPGGSWSDEKVKARELDFRFATSFGVFESRIDYDARESPKTPPPEEEKLEEREESPPPTYGAPGQSLVHVARLSGFLSVEKVAGRPGWTRLVAERSAVFESPNHDRFRIETLIFWLTSELLSFVLPHRDDVP